MTDTLRIDALNRQHNRRATWAGNSSSNAHTKTRHHFEARGATKHLERLEKDHERGDFGGALSVRTSPFTFSPLSHLKIADSLPRSCC